MIVSIRDAARLMGIVIMSFCAVFVCTLFLNFNIDIAGIEELITNEYQLAFYDALVSTGKVVSAVSGGCLLITAVILMFFYIKQYINSHCKELGILKALGYSDFRIAKSFWVFGTSVFLGTALGFAASFPIMPVFYETQNNEGLLPEYSIGFHPQLFFFLVLLPSLFFAAVSVLYAMHKLKAPVLSLIKDIPAVKKKKARVYKSEKKLPFIKELNRATFRERKSLVFFIAFGGFCFSAMGQMSLSMDELSSRLMAVIIISIGVVLAVTSLFLAVSSVINANKKTIAIMKAEGYSVKDCQRGIFDSYRPAAYAGFAVGTVYQYALLKIMVSIVFADIENIPDYNFDFAGFIICLVAFGIFYEIMMRYCGGKIGKTSVKSVMEE
ncbi:MAG: ABC transporter permease [Firmicutes bacterium]|nr:ABC transporter permease [[Eubacterium] siraeum]MCM1488808.1 ABC transporter permease [Bacillota bacterium]